MVRTTIRPLVDGFLYVHNRSVPSSVRVPGIEPGSFDWQPNVLPLNHTRLGCYVRIISLTHQLFWKHRQPLKDFYLEIREGFDSPYPHNNCLLPLDWRRRDDSRACLSGRF